MTLPHKLGDTADAVNAPLKGAMSSRNWKAAKSNDNQYQTVVTRSA
jgi:hypothetical protein